MVFETELIRPMQWVMSLLEGANIDFSTYSYFRSSQLQALYEPHWSELWADAKRKLERFPDDPEIQAYYNRIEEDLALRAEKIAFFYRYTTPKQLAEGISEYTLDLSQKGSVTQPIQTPGGYVSNGDTSLLGGDFPKNWIYLIIGGILLLALSK